MELNGYDLAAIGNIDETPLTFDLPRNWTVDKLGNKTVMVKTSGDERLHFTYVLRVTANGGKLPPMVIFKHKKIPAKMKFVSGVLVRVNEKGMAPHDLK